MPMSSLIPSEGIGEETYLRLARDNFNFFCNWCFNEKHRNAWFHKIWCEAIQDDTTKRGLNLAPRNSGKTTIWAKKAPLWLLGRNPNLKILILSRTANRATNNMRFIKTNIENNPKIRRIFPALEPSIPWSDDELTIKNTRMDGEASVVARGLGGSIPGLRADILIVDDLIDKTNTMTEAQRQKVHEFWDEQVIPTVNPDGRIFIVGTIFHNKDFYGRIQEDESYKQRLFKFPAFKVGEDGKLVLDENKQPISYWPDRWPTDKLLERQREITYTHGSLAWNSQYMLDASGYEGRLFKSDWLTFYNVKDDLEPKLGALDYVMAIDPNIKEDPTSDNTAIVTAAVDRRRNEIYILDIYAEPLDFLLQVKKINEYAHRINLSVGKMHLPGEQRISKIGIESVAYQRSLQQTGYLLGLPVVEVQHTRTDKTTRILRMAPHVENGRIRFPDPEVHPDIKWWDKMFDEYVQFPRGRRDDMMDALEILIDVAGLSGSTSSIPYGPGTGAETNYRQLFEPREGMVGREGIPTVFNKNRARRV